MANIANPCRGNINPDDSDRKKMIFKMTKVLKGEDKFDLTSKNISDFRDHVEEAAHKFSFGFVLFNITTFHNDDRAVIETVHLVAVINVVTKGHVLGFSSQVWGNDDGYHMIDSNDDPEKDPVVLQ